MGRQRKKEKKEEETEKPEVASSNQGPSDSSK